MDPGDILSKILEDPEKQKRGHQLVEDLKDLRARLARNRSNVSDVEILDGIRKYFFTFSHQAIFSLKLPGSYRRGTYPKELLVIGIRKYRQTFFKPYRVIYRVIGKRVHNSLIADGRRDMQSLLSRRLLEA